MPKTFKVNGQLLGKRAVRHDHRTLKLADYLPTRLPAQPLAAGYTDKIDSWPMFMNDTIGNCVIAAAGHMVQEWTTYASSPVLLTDKDILYGYEQVGGYVPGDPSTDQGCDMLTALNFWRKTGFGGHKIAAYVSINIKKPSEIALAVWLFGNVFAGFALPLTVQNQTTWSVPRGGTVGDGSPGSWGGHCVPIVGYSNVTGSAGTQIVTWGDVYSVTWPFISKYADELYAVLSPDWIERTGKAPSGFNMAQLQADLAAIK